MVHIYLDDLHVVEKSFEDKCTNLHLSEKDDLTLKEAQSENKDILFVCSWVKGGKKSCISKIMRQGLVVNSLWKKNTGLVLKRCQSVYFWLQCNMRNPNLQQRTQLRITESGIYMERIATNISCKLL